MLAPLAAAHRTTRARRTRLVAVTGSFGKTTTTRTVAAALGREPPSRAGNHSSFLAAALLGVRAGDAHAVVEVGIDAPGQMTRYARLLRPDVAVVTAIGAEHNRGLPGAAVTRAEKSELVRALPADGLAVLNGDDEDVLWMAGRTRARITTFGFGPGNDVRASDVGLDWPHGTRLTVHAGGEARPLRIRLIGRHQVPAVLAAVAVALQEGVELDAALSALAALGPSPGRLETVALADGAFVVRDDFKAPEPTIDAALDVLAEIPARRRVVVLGDVEDAPSAPEPIYARLGERVAAVASRAVFVHLYRDGPRYAPAAVAAGMPAAAAVEAGPSAARAAREAAAGLGAGDVVLVKGAGSQRLDRVALALAGRAVRCGLWVCPAKSTRCATCPMLERGWDRRRVVI